MLYVRIRRDTATAWSAANPILQVGQIGYDSTNRNLKVGDGTTAWNTLLAVAAAASITDGSKGDITTSGAGATWTINAGAVTLAKLANIATASFLGRVTALAGVPEVIGGTQATTLLDVFTSTLKGLAPASGGGTVNFLRADGTWAAPPGGGGSGDMLLGTAQTVTALKTFLDGTFGLRNVANTFTALFTNTNTAARTYTLKDASGTLAFTSDITGTNSGVNTGDQTITLTGDVGGSGTGSFAATIAADAVSNAKLANMATATFKGRTTAGTGDPEDLTVAQAKALLNLTGTNSGDQTITLTGDVDGSGTGSFAATIATNAVTNAKRAQLASARIRGRVTAGTGDTEDLTGTQATTLLDVFTSTLKGLAPASGGGTANFLRADGTWAAPAGGGGGGDMLLGTAQTNTALKTFLDGTFGLRNVANTFTALFTNTNTAARTYTLKDASGTLAFVSDITGTNSGVNTGDQTITLTGDVGGSGTGSFAATIAADVVTNAKLANMATSTIKGRVTAATGDPEDLTATQVRTLIDSPQLSAAQNFTAAQGVTPVALTDAANIATNAALGNIFTVTLGGNRTLDNPTNVVAGRTYAWVLTQDATGSRTLAYGTAFDFPGGTAPVLTTTASAVDLITGMAISTSRILCVVNKAFS